MTENRITHINAPEVEKAVSNAARAACAELDLLFPGSDNGGISSNFEGMLTEVIALMLKGESVTTPHRGHQTYLPRLAVDDTFFGDPHQCGTTFALLRRVQLPIKRGDTSDTPREGYVGINANGNPVELSELDTVYGSYEEAAQAALRYLRECDFSVESALIYNLRVLSVEPDHSKSTGYVLTRSSAAA